jgi:glycerol-3-phosphate acyltransferase PlsY
MPDVSIWAAAALALAIGYLLGSIPFGVVLTRLAGVGDVRKIGSGNIGATNVLRTGRRDLAALTLLADALKGTVAVLIGQWILGGDVPAAAGALGAFLGHLFPVWLGFKGGKGVATYLGALVAISPWSAAVFAIAWLAVASVSRWSSLGALAASLATLVSLTLLDQRVAAVVFSAMTVLLWVRHSENIRRLLAGTEPRIGKA